VKRILAALAVFLGSCIVSAASVPVGHLFYPVPPCRMIDTRSDGTGPMSQGDYRVMHLTGSCGIPDGVAAVSANIAAANIQGGVNTNGVLTVGLPALTVAGAALPINCQPTAPCEAWLNFTKPFMTQVNNSGAAAVNAQGNILVGLFMGGGTADVIIDVDGYYAPDVDPAAPPAVFGGQFTCSAPTIGTSWAKTTCSVDDARVKATQLVQCTYSTRVADDQIPCRVFGIHDGGFSVEVQTGTSAMWLAYTP
jgi:hypothetical protein